MYILITYVNTYSWPWNRRSICIYIHTHACKRTYIDAYDYVRTHIQLVMDSEGAFFSISVYNMRKGAVKPGDIIKVKARDRSMKMAREALQRNLVRVPDFLEIVNSTEQAEGRMTRMPNRQDVDERITDIREQLIIEIATR